MLNLRLYQKRDLISIKKVFEEFNSVIYTAPTGSGKSVLLSQWVLDNPDKKILILVHRRELIISLRKRLQAEGLKIGLIIRNIEENLDANVVVASVRTVTRDKRIQTIISHNYDYVVIDECHHTNTSSYENILKVYKEHNPNLKTFGLTATPTRTDKKSLNKHYETIVISDTIQQLIDQKYLANYKVYYTPIGDEFTEEVTKFANDYQITSLSTFMRKKVYLDYLVESYKRFGQEKQMIVFCVDKAHAKMVMDAYIDQGYISIAHIDSDTDLDERELILETFEQGELQILTCIEALSEGIDIPECSVVQLARPTKSLTLYMQMVGRGLRPKADGSDLIILDCAMCTMEFGTISSPKHWSLNPEIDPNNPRKKNRIVGRKQDGSLTEDTKDLEYLELVELTPEDYILQMAGDIESAERFNSDIDRQINETVGSIFELISKRAKLSDIYICDSSQMRKKYPSFTIKCLLRNPTKNIWDDDDYKYEKKYITVKRDSSNSFSFSMNGWSEAGNDQNASFNEFKWQSILGDIAGAIYGDKDFRKKFENLFEEAIDLQQSKVDIDKLNQDVEAIKKQAFVKELEQYLITNSIIDLEDAVYLSDFFARDSGSIHRLHFQHNSLKALNHIQFYRIYNKDKDPWMDRESKTVKKEVVIDALYKRWSIPTVVNN